MSLRRVGVAMMAVHSDASFRTAGVGRTVVRLVEAMAKAHPEVRFLLHVNPEFQAGPELRLPNVALRTVRRRRLFERFGAFAARFGGIQVWFAPAFDAFESHLVPQVSLIHDVFPFTHPEWFKGADLEALRRTIARQIRLSRRLVANSEATRRALDEAFPGASARCVVAPLGLGSLDSPSGETMAIKGRYILAVGTLEPRKNLPALFRAWGEVVRSGRHPDVGLVVAGGKGWGDEDHRRTLRELGIEGRVHFAGYVPDESLPSLFAAAELFVMPSLDEGFGIPALEAMAYGAPVLSSDAGALREVGGEAARYFAPTDESAMARAIADALDRPGERAAWVAKGRERAKEFGWEKTATLVFETLRQAAGF